MVDISNAYCGIELFLGTTPVWGSVYSKKAIAFLLGAAAAAAYAAARTSFLWVKAALNCLHLICCVSGVPILSKESYHHLAE